MESLTSRFYADDRDLERMLALVSASTALDGVQAGHFHRGDVVWGLFQNQTIDPSARIRLFEDDGGALRGFVWLHPPRGFGLHPNTALPGASSIVAEMIRWAEAHLTATAPEAEPITTFRAEEVPSASARLKEALAVAGYRPAGQPEFQLNAREVRGDIEAPRVPAGTVVRPVRVDDPAEVEARVALHLEVWDPSRFSIEGYARLRAQPVYRPDLDLVAVTPEGELASYGIVWWDPDTRTGEFEPVGTAARFRRQGYGKALLLEGLRRLRVLGATDALVISSTASEFAPSRFLYASAGFRAVVQFETWEHDTA